MIRILIFLTLAPLLVACGNPGALAGSETSVTRPGNGSGGGTQTSPVSLDSEEQTFVSLINAYRVQNGLVPLKVSVTLTQASHWMSQDMASHNYLGHTDSQGHDPGTRIGDFGYMGETTWGENVAAGNSTAQATFDQWKNSPAHNANMLGSAYRAMGVGRASNGSSAYGWYWTTDFGDAVDAILK